MFLPLMNLGANGQDLSDTGNKEEVKEKQN